MKSNENINLKNDNTKLTNKIQHLTKKLELSMIENDKYNTLRKSIIKDQIETSKNYNLQKS
jgi:hypothetical protein